MSTSKRHRAKPPAELPAAGAVRVEATAVDPATPPEAGAVEVEATAVDPPASSGAGFPVVGIGASAGGLAAFEAFFSAMPAGADCGAAFVLVQHLAPDHKSILAELVRRYTRMEVFEVEDGMRVKPNCAYIIPPNRDMAFLDGALQLFEPTLRRGLRLPIDFFFRSLAQDQHERAICVVLSGTGSDGTLGVRAVKGEGGMVMAQTPESTEFDGMPRSAIDSGLVDYVLPPAEMPAHLVAYLAHAFGPAPRPAAPATAASTSAFKKVFVLLRSRTGHDFSQYKQKTITRRIERRMAVHQVERLDDYVRFLQQTPAEVDALFRDLLIGVTSFFRDPAAFAALEARAIPRLFAGKPAGAPIRVWVPGCSTGEEAYSIAILLQERMAALQRSFKVQVFATDIDGMAIERALAGVYPASIAADVTPERLARCFSQEAPGDAYRVHKDLRDLLIFSEQDVIKDPPFSRLDLISCRNLLIYLGGDLQQRLIPLFHYALNPGGTLFLGTSETVGEHADLFATIDLPAKLHQRKPDVHGAHRHAMGRFLPPLTTSGGAARAAASAPGRARNTLREVTERTLLQHHAPVAVLVDEQGEILYLHGRTGRYLEPAPGDAVFNVLTMAREWLRPGLTDALHRAAARQETVRQPGLRVEADGVVATVELTVRPVSGGAAAAPAAAAPTLYLVVFEPARAAPGQEASTAAGTAGDARDAGREDDARVAALRHELQAKEDYLKAANEELETANEEHTSANEELQATNEELQSTNEELETSKEELQSVNEELATVNTELQQKVADLSRANDDMSNLLVGTGIGTLFVDHHLCIRRFTPAVTEVIRLIATDIGRPVDHIVANLVGYDRLAEDVQAVLATLVPSEVEVRTRAGAWFSLRIRPYRTLENVIEGAVITFVDITEIRQAREAMRESEALRHLAAVVRDARDAIVVQDLAGRVLAWNPGAARLYGWSEAEALAMNVRDLVPADQREAALAAVQRLVRAEALEPYRAQRLAKGGAVVAVWLTATALVTDGGEVYAIATTERAAEGAPR